MSAAAADLPTLAGHSRQTSRLLKLTKQRARCFLPSASNTALLPQVPQIADIARHCHAKPPVQTMSSALLHATEAEDLGVLTDCGSDADPIMC